MAKDLVKREPTDEHRRCLFEATLGRAAQLRSTGHLPDAVMLLRSVIEDLRYAPDFAERLAGDLIRAGDWKTADEVSRRIADPAAPARLERLRTDAAVLLGEAGLARLSEELRTEAAAVLRGLAAMAGGDDATASAAVQSIPSASPFYEWRLLIGGLVAYYAGQPFMESWEGLSRDRAPWAIASVFCAAVDPVFLTSSLSDLQPGATQRGAGRRTSAGAQPPSPARQGELATLKKQLHPEPWLDGLEIIHNLLEQGNLDTALQRVAEVVRVLPPQCSDIRDRLIRVLYWEVARTGARKQIDRFARICGRPPDDPLLHRLCALHFETHGETAGAQEAWAAYAESLGQSNVVRPADIELARSLVWLHMGELAGSTSPIPGLPLPLSELLDDGECPLSAIDCYRRAVDLSPQNLEAHERLLTHLHGAGEQKEVTRAARQLLQSFPEHQIALEILAEDAFRAERSEEAVALQQRVARTRPHDERVLSKLDSYQLGLARFRAQHGKFDEARALLGAQLAKEDTGSSRYDILCRLAAVEIKAGDAERGQQVFEQACQSAPKPLAAVFRMLIESHRLPLDAAYRRTFDQEFSNGLRGEPDGPTALAMLSTVSAFQRAGITYGGLQTHRRRVFGYLKHAQDVPFSRAELVEICQSLMPFPNDKHVVHFATRGRQEYPDDPHFPYFLAMHHISLGPKKCPFTRVKALLESALALAKHAPDAHDLAEAINAARSFLEMGRLSYQLERDLRRPGPGAVFDALADILGLQGQEDAFDAIECEGKLDREKAPPKPRKRTADPQQRSLWDDF